MTPQPGAEGAPINVGDLVECRIAVPGHPDRGIPGQTFGRVEATGNGFLCIAGRLMLASRFVRTERPAPRTRRETVPTSRPPMGIGQQQEMFA